MSDAWDVVVVGAGPAGLAAATLLAEHQARVLVLDEQPAPGGQIYRGIERAAQHPALLSALGPDYAFGVGLAARFRASGAAYRANSLVWQVTAGGREVWFSDGGRSHLAQAAAVILASGAMERPVPVPGWTLPGVMTAGALQILLKSSGVIPNEPFVVAGSGPLLYLIVRQCLAAGARPAAVLDTTSRANQWAALRHLPAALRGEGMRYLAKGLAMLAALRRSNIPRHRHVSDIRIEGTDAVSAIAFRSGGTQHRIAARVVALHEGVIPAQQMARSIGCAFAWDDVQRCFAPVLDEWGNSSIDGVLIAGDAGGIGGARAAEHAGRLAALEALHRLGRIDRARRDTLAVADCRARRAHLAIRRFLDVLYAPRQDILTPPDDVTVCRCEEIAAGAVRAVVRQGCLGPNQAKAFLRAGMGACQGRLCGPVVTELIADARGVGPAEVGYYRIRPPLKPLMVGELVALDGDSGCGSIREGR